MGKPKLTDEQIVALLRAAERGENTIGELCRKAGVFEQSFHQTGQGSQHGLRRRMRCLEEDAEMPHLVNSRFAGRASSFGGPPALIQVV